MQSVNSDNELPMITIDLIIIAELANWPLEMFALPL